MLRYILIFLSLPLLSQDYQYTQYTTSNGLPSSEVYDIIQDDWGYIWFSTDHGLCRYDGYNFKNYSTNDGLPDNTTFNFFKNENGEIWCSAFNQTMFIISGESPTFRHYEHNKVLQSLPQEFVINDLIFDSEGSLYFTFLHRSGYLKIYADGTSENYLGNIAKGPVEITYIEKSNLKGFTYYTRIDSNYLKPPGPIGKSIHSTLKRTPRNTDGVSFNYSGNSYFIHENGIQQVDSLGKTKFTPISSFILELLKLDESHFWVSSISGGARIFDEYGNPTRHILKDLSVTMIYKDHEGGMWVSTLRNGIFHIRNKEILNINLSNGNVGVSDLALDKAKNLWVGLRNGDVYKRSNGLFKLIHKAKENSINARFSHGPSGETLYYNADFYLRNDQNQDSILIGSNLGFHIIHDSLKKLIYINHHQGVSSTTNKSNELKKEFTGIRAYDLEFFNNQMYLASKTGLYLKRNNKVLPVDSNHIVLSSRLNDLCTMNGNLVLASSGHGISFYNEDTLWTISQKRGLTGDFISKLYVEDSFNLWACTNSGLNRIKFNNDSTYLIQKIDFSDGLISNEVTDVEISRDTVWVATREGLSCFNKNILSQSEEPINYYLKNHGVLIDDEILSKQQTLKLPYNKSRIEFKFSGISFNESEKLTYRYQLKGLEEKWSYTENQSVLYSSLPAGKYQFIVEVKGENKIWGLDRLETFVTIYPPYWKTWWFIIIAIVTIFFLAYLFFRYRVFDRNRDLIRELLRQGLKKVNRKPTHLLIRDAGKEIKIQTKDILYVKSEGNYLKVVTEKDAYLYREKIGNFLSITPDPLEFIRVRRSYIVRIDKVTQKGKKHLQIGDYNIQVGETYLRELDKIVL